MSRFVISVLVLGQMLASVERGLVAEESPVNRDFVKVAAVR